MNFAVAIAVVILIVGAFYASTATQPPEPKQADGVLPTLAVTIAPEDNESREDETTPIQPTPTPQKLSEATQPHFTSNEESEEWYYPNAEVRKANENKITLVTSDDPSIVTQWYKDRINKMGFSAVSIVLSTANDNTQNQLSAAKENEKIEITIERKAGENITKITLEVSS